MCPLLLHSIQFNSILDNILLSTYFYLFFLHQCVSSTHFPSHSHPLIFTLSLSLSFRHIIGKDIIWFHCVIWPCILMSAGVALPVGVFSHGFVNAADGRKMSKSYNNAIDPHEVRTLHVQQQKMYRLL